MSIRISSVPLVNAPGMFDLILRPGGFADSFDASVHHVANRVYALASLVPAIPAGVLLGIAEGKIAWHRDGGVVVIECEDTVPSPPAERPDVAAFEERQKGLPRPPASFEPEGDDEGDSWTPDEVSMALDALHARDVLIKDLLSALRGV